MKEIVKKALLFSIFFKWEGILACKNIDKGPVTCPLCHLFYPINCRGCPVYVNTGKVHCQGTPYDEWERLVHDEHGKWLGSCESQDSIDIAVQEQEYLISLLAKVERDNLESLYNDFVRSLK